MRFQKIQTVSGQLSWSHYIELLKCEDSLEMQFCNTRLLMGESRIEVRLQGETVWLNLDQMAELFQRNKSTISRHIKNVFEEGELQPDATVALFATVQTEGKND